MAAASLAGAAFLATTFLTATFFAGAFVTAAFLAGAFFTATFFAGTAFLAAAFWAGAAFLAATFLAGALLAGAFLATGAFFGAAFLAAGFFAVAIVFSLITLQRALHVWSTSSDSRRWAEQNCKAQRREHGSPQHGTLCGGLFAWGIVQKSFCYRLQSQERAPPDWYSITRVSKKLRSFFKSIISLIQGNGFSSLGKSVSRPIWVARRLAM